jgi:hypothetical protein
MVTDGRRQVWQVGVCGKWRDMAYIQPSRGITRAITAEVERRIAMNANMKVGTFTIAPPE